MEESCHFNELDAAMFEAGNESPDSRHDTKAGLSPPIASLLEYNLGKREAKQGSVCCKEEEGMENYSENSSGSFQEFHDNFMTMANQLDQVGRSSTGCSLGEEKDGSLPDGQEDSGVSSMQRRESQDAEAAEAPSFSLPKCPQLLKSGKKIWERKLRVMLSDQLECQKELVKQFLLEAFITEEVRVDKFQSLPYQCQKFVSILLRETLSFVLEPAAGSQGSAQAGRPQRVLRLRNEYVESLSLREAQEYHKFSSIAFVAECYMYGLSKQLKVPALQGQPANPTLLGIITDFLHPDSTDAATKEAMLEKLKENVRLLLNFQRTQTSSACIIAALPPRLVLKLRQMKISSLVRFYPVKLRKYFSGLIDGISSFEQASRQLCGLDSKVDLLSNYLLLPENPYKHADL